MKKYIPVLVLLPALCLGQSKYTERELWQGLPVERLPLDHVKLVVKYDAARIWGIPGRGYRKPHRIAVGMENIGTNLIEEVEILFMFRHGQMLLQTTTNGVLTRSVLLGGFRGIKTWSAINPGESTFFVPKPLWEWFPAITNAPDGQFCFWWVIGTNESDRLILNKAGPEITKED